MNLLFTESEPSFEDGRTLLNGSTLDAENKVVEAKPTSAGDLLISGQKGEIEEEKKGEQEFQFNEHEENEEDQLQ